MFSLFKPKEKDRLYKVTFVKERGYGSDRGSCTLLVVAENTTDAVKKFYEMVNNNVINITEFTEIKLDGLEGIKTDGQ